MKNSRTLFLLVLIIICSCATNQNIRPIAVDIQTNDTIAAKGLSLKKGKICFINSASYWLQSNKGFTKNSNGNYSMGQWFEKNHTSTTYQTSHMDTIISDEFVNLMALQEVIKHVMPVFSFQVVNFNEVKNQEGNLNLDVMINEYHTDIIIDLSSLLIHVAGGSSDSYHTISALPPPNTSGEGLYNNSIYSEGSSNNIAMNYQSLWRIIVIEDNTTRELNLTGQTKYDHKDNLQANLLACAKQAGKDLSALLVSHD